MSKKKGISSERAKELYAAKAKCTGTRTNGEPCVALAIKGTTLCYQHSPRQARGARSGRFKTGVYSVVLPRDIVERYEILLSDRGIVETRTSVALATVRIEELIKKLEENEAAGRYILLSKAVKDLRRQIDKGETTSVVAFQKIASIIDSKIEEYQKWSEIYEVMELKRKLVDTESKRLKDIGAVLNAEQAMAFIMSIAGISKRYLPEESMAPFIAEMGKTLKLAVPAYKMVETRSLAGEMLDDGAVEGEIVEDE
jgi:hypothetical protein